MSIMELGALGRFDQLGQEFIFGLAASYNGAVAAGQQRLVRELPFVVAQRVHSEPGMRAIWQRFREVDARGASRVGERPIFSEAVDTEL